MFKQFLKRYKVKWDAFLTFTLVNRNKGRFYFHIVIIINTSDEKVFYLISGKKYRE